MPILEAKNAPVHAPVVNLELELKREKLFLSDYPKFVSGELNNSDMELIVWRYKFKTRAEAKQWVSFKLKS